MVNKSDYKKLYDSSDITFKSLKYNDYHWTNWGNGVFIGNGQLGAMAFKKTADGVTLELGRNDVEAHNYLAGIDWCYPRVPIGDLKLYTDKKVINESLHLGLWNAEIDGVTETENGALRWSAFAANSVDAFVIRFYKNEKGETLSLETIAEYGVSPRLLRVEVEVREKAAPLPPKPLIIKESDISGWRQPLVNDNGEIDGGFSVAVMSEEDNDSVIYYVSVMHNRFGTDAWEEAVSEVKKAVNFGYNKLYSDHLDYWHNYYGESYLEFSNDKWQKFYNIQMYKLASATREKALEVIDSQGPWLTKTGWPGTWWNLNVQLSYSPLYTSNHLGVAKSLINALKDREEQLRENAKPVCDDGIYIHRSSGRMLTRNSIYTPEQIKAGNLVCFELGNITWIMFTIYRHFRYSMDMTLLKETLFPLLKAAVNVFVAIAYEKEDGRIHLPKTTSPEYPGPFNPRGNTCPWEDTTYDLSLFRWGLTTLIELSDEFGIEDELYAKWQETLDKLCDIPTDENGISVARGMPYEISHRHYSHLLPIFPLHQLDMANSEDRLLADMSLTHWQSLPEKLVGYSCTGSSCMASTLGDGDRALAYLEKILLLDGISSYVAPNTMYLEPVGGPVIETPLTVAEAIHYMMIQSYNRVVKVFPAVPSSIKDVYFERFLTEGAFLVTAKRENGVNLWVKVKAQKKGTLKIDTGLVGAVKSEGGKPHTENGLFVVQMEENDEILFYVGEKPSEVL